MVKLTAQKKKTEVENEERVDQRNWAEKHCLKEFFRKMKRSS